MFLNTRDKSSNSDNGNAFFNIEEVSKKTRSNVHSITLENVSFPNMIYPVNSTNNKIYFQEDNDTGTTYTATLTANRDYNGNTLATELETQLDASTGNAYNYTVSYSTTTRKLTISENSNNPFRIVGGDNNGNAVIGYDVNEDDGFQTSALELAAPVDVSGPKYIDLLVNSSNTNFTSSSTNHPLVRIPLTTSFGEIEFFNAYLKQPILINSLDTTLELQLRDDKNKVLDLPFNCYIGYTFIIE